MIFIKRCGDYQVLDSRDHQCGALRQSLAGRWFFDSNGCSLHQHEAQSLADKLRELNGGERDGQEND